MTITSYLIDWSIDLIVSYLLCSYEPTQPLPQDTQPYPFLRIFRCFILLLLSVLTVLLRPHSFPLLHNLILFYACLHRILFISVLLLFFSFFFYIFSFPSAASASIWYYHGYVYRVATHGWIMRGSNHVRQSVQLIDSSANETNPGWIFTRWHENSINLQVGIGKDRYMDHGWWQQPKYCIREARFAHENFSGPCTVSHSWWHRKYQKLGVLFPLWCIPKTLRKAQHHRVVHSWW